MADLNYPIAFADLNEEEAREVDTLFHAYKDERRKNKTLRAKVKELRTKLAARELFTAQVQGTMSGGKKKGKKP